jgi:hypothetical protein
MEFFERLPVEMKALGYDLIPIEDKVTALQKSPVFSTPYGMEFFEKMSVEDKAMSLEKSPVWSQPYGLEYFGRMQIEPKLAQLRKSPVFSQPYALEFFGATAKKEVADKIHRRQAEGPGWSARGGAVADSRAQPGLVPAV